MVSLKDWLTGHGLGEYESLFREHRIDLGSLSLINEDDLKELKIPLGDRKRIISAIRQERPQVSSAATAVSADNPDTRERRLLVVLFCDLVGSTEYASHLDPEDLEGILHPYRTTVKSIVEKHHGLTLIYEGDGVKAYFGSKIASEDEQEQALTAALEIRETVQNMELKKANRLEVRLGVATGTVIIGNFDAPMGPNAFGEALHLAARLHSLADPGGILVDQATYRSMRTIFEFEDGGAHQLKGFDGEIQVWKLINKKKVESRFAKRFRNTSLVGRRSEIDMLVNYWQRAQVEGKGAVVSISGEAGIGKSRLAHELQTRIHEDAETLLCQCSPYHTDSVYFPVLETLANAINLNTQRTEREKLERLAEFLSQRNIALDRTLQIFAGLLNIDNDGSESELSESLQEEISRSVLTDYVLSLSRDRALYLVVEDIHWIDATSRDFFKHLASLCADQPILMVMTSRDSGPRENIPSDAREMNLGRLRVDESRRLLQELCTDHDLPAEFRGYIERKAEGVPLYIEELASTILDTGLRETDTAAAEGVKEIEMSGILQSSLLSKLDRLGATKEVAELAATIGREFQLELLEAIVPIGPEQLRKSLDKLLDAGVIYAKSARESRTYVFKHALIQDTALGLIPRQRREATHRKIAGALEQGFSGVANAEPELIAFHCHEGGEFLKASEYWFAAGRKAAKTWAKDEALQLLKKGLDSLRKTEESRVQIRAELDFQLEIGDVLYAKYGYITEAGEQAYSRSLELSQVLGDHDSPVRALDGLFGIHFNSCHFDQTIDISERLMTLGKEQDRIAALVLGMQFKGMSLFCRGDFEEADDHLTEALTHIDRADEIGSDFPSMALIYLSWTRFIRDLPEQAVECFEEARSIVRVQAPYRKAAALGDGCILYALMDQPAQVDALIEDLIPLVKRYGFNLWFNIGEFFKGWSASRRGHYRGLEMMESMLTTLGDQEIDKTFYLGLLGRAYMDFEEYAKAVATIDAGLAQAERTGERYYLAELLRVKADLKLRTAGDMQHCRSLYQEAVDCARAQGAISWLRRAEQELAKLKGQ